MYTDTYIFNEKPCHTFYVNKYILKLIKTYLMSQQTQNTVYEIVSDMSGRQDAVEERLSSLEDKMQSLSDRLEALPDIISRCLQQHQERIDQRRNFLHPDTAAASVSPVPMTPSPLLIPHSR